MKVQLLVVAVLVLFGFGNAQTPECLAATQARQGVEDTCFGGNITEFDILLGQLLTSIGDFETGTAMIITNKVAYETALGQFCNQTCLDIHANYIKECSNISVDEVTADFELYIGFFCVKNGDDYCLIDVAQNSALLGTILACGTTNCNETDACKTALNTATNTLGCCYNFYQVVIDFLVTIGQKEKVGILAPYGTVFESCGLTQPSTCDGSLTNPFKTGGSGALSLGAISVVLTIGATAIGQFLVHLFM